MAARNSTPRRLAALVAVARAYQLAPRDLAEAENDDTPSAALDPLATLRAELAAVVARRGDAARYACDNIASALAAIADAPAPALDLCLCPACEGRDDRGEGDA